MYNSLRADLGHPLRGGVYQMDMGQVERQEELVVEGGSLAPIGRVGLEGFLFGDGVASAGDIVHRARCAGVEDLLSGLGVNRDRLRLLSSNRMPLYSIVIVQLPGTMRTEGPER